MFNVSGSSMQIINGMKQMTKPEYVIDPNEKNYDWCSNCGRTYDDHPWIIFRLKRRKFKINGYFIRAGCCTEGCCSEDYNYHVDCCLYSWLFQISDDGVTWTTIHKIEKSDPMMRCNEKTYKLDKTYVTRYIRIYQHENAAGFPPVLALNKFELFGDVIKEPGADDEDPIEFYDDDEDVSIIGHISRSGKIQN